MLYIPDVVFRRSQTIPRLGWSSEANSCKFHQAIRSFLERNATVGTHTHSLGIARLIKLVSQLKTQDFQMATIDYRQLLYFACQFTKVEHEYGKAYLRFILFKYVCQIHCGQTHGITNTHDVNTVACAMVNSLRPSEVQIPPWISLSLV